MDWSDQRKRPMSWHPGFGTCQLPAAAHRSADTALGNTIADFETLAVSGPIQPLFEEPEDARTISTVSHGHSFSSGPRYDGWGGVNVDPSIESYACDPNQSSLGADQLYVQTPYDQFYNQAGLDISYYTDTSLIPMNYHLPTSGMDLETQYPINPTYGQDLTLPPQITEKKSKELVGMGLYDDKNGSMLQATNLKGLGDPYNLADLYPESRGKGLKLEETWHPPGEEPVDEVDDSSSDEADDLPNVSPVQQPQKQVLSGYEDLSNQTFFFENDDQYSNYFSFDQAMQYCEPKTSDPISGNFLWL